MSRLMFMVAYGLLGAGCAMIAPPPVATLPAHQLWRDSEFQPAEAPGALDRQVLFALPADLQAKIERDGIRNASVQRRVDYLVTLLFGPELKSFQYATGRSTTAAETWRLKRGDCLSLSVLAYSIGRAIGLRVRLQEVPVPQIFDRRGSVDFVGRHVNVLIRNEARLFLNNEMQTSGNVVIDFDPQVGWLRGGRALTEDGVLARFYANIGASHFARDELAAAYAWFKAALRVDPGYAPGYSNLAQLYRRKGLLDSAEALLLHAIARDAADDTPVRALHTLLQSMGRDREALHYAELLRVRQAGNPYHWLGQGLEYLRAADHTRAVTALERAEALSTGFDEVHQYLAVAYWRDGKASKARQQLAILASLRASRSPERTGLVDPVAAALGRKFDQHSGSLP